MLITRLLHEKNEIEKNFLVYWTKTLGVLEDAKMELKKQREEYEDEKIASIKFYQEEAEWTAELREKEAENREKYNQLEETLAIRSKNGRLLESKQTSEKLNTTQWTEKHVDMILKAIEDKDELTR